MHHFDPGTGKGKTSVKSVGRVMQNLGLRTDNTRVKDEDQRLRAWLLNKDALARIQQTLYLDDIRDLGTSGTSGTSPSALLCIEEREPTYIQRNVPNVPKPILKTVCGVCYKQKEYQNLGVPVKGKVGEGTCEDCGNPAELLIDVKVVK